METNQYLKTVYGAVKIPSDITKISGDKYLVVVSQTEDMDKDKVDRLRKLWNDWFPG